MFLPFEDERSRKAFSWAAIYLWGSIARHLESCFVFTTWQVVLDSDVLIGFEQRATGSQVYRNILLSTVGFLCDLEYPSALEALHKLLIDARSLLLRLTLIGRDMQKTIKFYNDIERERGCVENIQVKWHLRCISWKTGYHAQRFCIFWRKGDWTLFLETSKSSFVLRKLVSGLDLVTGSSLGKVMWPPILGELGSDLNWVPDVLVGLFMTSSWLVLCATYCSTIASCDTEGPVEIIC